MRFLCVLGPVLYCISFAFCPVGRGRCSPVGHLVGHLVGLVAIVVFSLCLPSLLHCIFTAFSLHLPLSGCFGGVFPPVVHRPGQMVGRGVFGGEIACFSPVAYRGRAFRQRGRFLLRFFCVLRSVGGRSGVSIRAGASGISRTRFIRSKKKIYKTLEQRYNILKHTALR